MRRKQVWVVISLLLLSMVCMVMINNVKESVPIVGYTDPEQFAGVVVRAEENEGLSLDIYGYQKYDNIYLFLPCRVNMEKVSYYSIDREGHFLERFETNFLEGEGQIGTLHVIALQSNIPSLQISLNKEDGTLESINNSKDHSQAGYGDMILEVNDDLAKQNQWETVYYSNENDASSKETVRLRGRGNISWEEDKKPYSLKLERKLNLLGMGEAKNWVLLANAADYSLLRDEVFYTLASEMGFEYSPQMQQVDLFVDGEYQGVYSLCTKVEVKSTRVAIDTKKDYLFQWGMPGEEAFKVDFQSVKNPDFCCATMIDVNDEESLVKGKEIFQKVINEIENTDADNQLKHIDLESLAKYYWIQEFSKNTDATARSVYSIWRSDEEKMYMGPIWDMDRTAGVIEPFEREHDYLWPMDFSVKYEDWFVPLFQNQAFVNEVNRVYFEEGVRESLSNTYSRLDLQVEKIQKSADMNFIRWDVLGIEQNNKIVATMGNADYEAQTKWLSEWLRMRFEWIDEEMTKNKGISN